MTPPLTGRAWCCGEPIDKPHAEGCPFNPVGPIDYDGPAVRVDPRRAYLGDAVYVEEGNWPGQARLFVSYDGGRTCVNVVYLEKEMVDQLHDWMHKDD